MRVTAMSFCSAGPSQCPSYPLTRSPLGSLSLVAVKVTSSAPQPQAAKRGATLGPGAELWNAAVGCHGRLSVAALAAAVGEEGQPLLQEMDDDALIVVRERGACGKKIDCCVLC